MKKTARGFTLVELLVVISIIAILAVTGIVLYSGVSARGRDAKRIQEIQAIQTAMEKNYQPGATNPYVPLVIGDFANSIVPKDPRDGDIKCGVANAQTCTYCFYAKDTVQANDIGVAPSACGTMSGAAGTLVAAAAPAASKGYVVCANLETAAGVGGATYYCRASAQ